METLSNPNLKGPAAGSAFGSASLAARLDKTQALHLLVETGLMLASERSLDVITQCTLEAALKLCAADFGLFVYLHLAADGEPQQRCKFSGLDQAAMHSLAPALQLTEIVGEHTSDEDIPSRTRGVVRVVDVQSSSPAIRTSFAALPALRSYLAVPVRSHTGELYGAIVCGHTQPDVFHLESEELVATVAAQAGVAMETIRLGNSLSREIDIADRARAQQRETASRLHQALEAAHLGTWTWNRESDLLDLDEQAAHLFGVPFGVPITRKELRERIVVREDLEATTSRLVTALESRSNYTAEYRIDLADGRQTWVAASAVPLFAPGSTEVTGMVGNAQDITARKLQEQALLDSEKLAATGRLAATIAHEINNPLEAITNLIYLARTDPEVPPSVQKLLDTADSELARVAQIAQQTLGFYRDTTRPVTIDLNHQLVSTVELFARKMQSKGVTCKLDLEPNLVIFGMQGEVRQVISNLLVNAIDASSHSEIRIRARPRCQHGIEGISILIADHGAGIPAHVRAQLFTAFVTTKQSAGTGLGLWVTRGIVEKQGGSIRLRSSTGPSSGTIFRVFLPVKPTLKTDLK